MILYICCLILCSYSATVFALFEMCNHKVELKGGEKLYLNSPYYPKEYPIGSSCRYMIKAPQDYKIKFTCNIKLNTPPLATACQNEIFYFNREGSEILTESEFFCGTGKIERQSFLNQAVLSYISTPYYKRILLINSNKEAEEDMQKDKVHETEIKVKKQQPKATTTTRTPTTSKSLKENQLTTLIAAKTTTTTPPMTIVNILSTSFAQRFSSTTSLPTISSNPKEKVKAMDNTNANANANENKKVSNSFAYVVALLSNRIVQESKATTTNTTAKSLTTATIATTSRPASVTNLNEILPVKTCRNGSIATHKISKKGVAKVIAGQDYTTAQSPPPQVLASNSTPSSFFIRNTRLAEAGGSFTCFVEVVEPPCECGWSARVKIAGPSSVAGINEFPSMVGIMTIKNRKIFCGATVIHHRYMLSAAHCYMTPETNTAQHLTAVVGEHDFSTVLESFHTYPYDLIKIIIHEHFQTSSIGLKNDIALLKTRYSIQYNRGVGPICLPFYALNDPRGTVPFTGQRVEAAGWGTTSFGGKQSTILLKATLYVISSSVCQNINGHLPLGAFCTYANERDTCQYDSGGALYIRGERLYAVGIVSYGYACATGQPSINTRISYYLKWIKTHTPEAKYCTN